MLSKKTFEKKNKQEKKTMTCHTTDGYSIMVLKVDGWIGLDGIEIGWGEV